MACGEIRGLDARIFGSVIIRFVIWCSSIASGPVGAVTRAPAVLPSASRISAVFAPSWVAATMFVPWAISSAIARRRREPAPRSRSHFSTATASFRESAGNKRGAAGRLYVCMDTEHCRHALLVGDRRTRCRGRRLIGRGRSGHRGRAQTSRICTAVAMDAWQPAATVLTDALSRQTLHRIATHRPAGSPARAVFICSCDSPRAHHRRIRQSGGAGIQADLKTFTVVRRLRHERDHRADRAEHAAA